MTSSFYDVKVKYCCIMLSIIFDRPNEKYSKNLSRVKFYVNKMKKKH